MTLTLLQPLALLLLVPALGLAAWARATGRPVGVRLLVLAGLTLAAAQPTWLHPRRPALRVYVVDTSASVPAAEQARALQQITDAAVREGEEVGVVTLEPDPTWRVVPGQPLPERLAPPEQPPAHTALAAAIDTALAIFPRGSDGTLVVMTDGRLQDPAALDAVLARAAAQGVAVEGQALSPVRPAPELGGLWLDTTAAAPGETIQGTLLLHGGEAGLTDAIAEVYLTSGEDAPLLTVPGLTVAAGARAEVSLAVPLPADLEAGAAWLEARVVGAGAPAQAGVLIRRPPRVLLVGDRAQDTRYVQAALEAEGMAVEQRPAARPGTLEAFSLVVLVDTPTEGAGALPAAFVGGLARFVAEGGGLVVVGGEHAYDLGGWQDSPLADLLPVEIDPDGALKDDAVTLLLVLDKSGSMAEPADFGADVGRLIGSVSSRMTGGNPTGSKMRLANEGAIAAMTLLRDADQLGVLAVDTVPQWAVPLQVVQDREALAQQIARTKGAGGGIYLLTALEQAQEVMQQVDTPLRHIILFADASDVGEQKRGSETALGLVERMHRAQITLSVIGIGSEGNRDAAFLKELASQGGGRIHLTADARTLPALFAQETEQLLGAGLREAPRLRARQERWHRALNGIRFDEAPPLRGMNAVKRRPRTRVLLAEAESGAPLLALWGVGLGEVAALTTDAGARWGSRWLRWEGYARLWTQLARALTAADATAQDDVLSVTVGDDGRATARLTLRRADGLSEEAPGLTLQAAAEDGATLRLVPRVPAPGTWEARFPTRPGQHWTLTALDAQGQPLTSQEWIAPASEEGRWRTPDDTVLARLQQPRPDAEAAADAGTREAVPLSPWLLLLGALLLPVDALARRRLLGRLAALRRL